MIRSSRFGLIVFVASVLALPVSGAYAGGSAEYSVKAAFIYNFVKFVEWPGDKATARQSRIDICVVGDSPMSETGAVFQQASTPQLTLSLVNESSISRIASHCHIAFIGLSEKKRVGDILNALKGKPVLTVSDIDNFAEIGGNVEFRMQDNKVKLVVNAASATESDMRIDAQLLEIALKVIR